MNKHIKLVLAIVISLSGAVALQAQLGGIGKKIPGVGGGGGGAWTGDIGKLENDSFDKAAPAVDKLYQATLLLSEALALTISDKEKAINEGTKQGTTIKKMAAIGNFAKDAKKLKPEKVDMSPERQAKYKEGKDLYFKGLSEFVLVSAAVAKSIQEVVDQDPKLMLAHADLGKLGIACGKDLPKYVEVGALVWKIGKAKKISGFEGEAPSTAFDSK